MVRVLRPRGRHRPVSRRGFRVSLGQTSHIDQIGADRHVERRVRFFPQEGDIELAPSNHLQDLLRRDADIAVRMARPTQNALFARRIGSVHLSFFAHRDYLRRYGEPHDMAALRRHTLIGYDRLAPALEALTRVGYPVDRNLFGLRTDSDPAQLAYLRAGYGIGVCQRPLGRRDPDLVEILAEAFGFKLDFWVVMHEDLKTDQRMRALFDHLATGLKTYLDSDR